jgi:hypothetical protein
MPATMRPSTLFAMEFLRRLKLEMPERRFVRVELSSEPIPDDAHRISGQAYDGLSEKELDNLAEEFALRISPELTKCYELELRTDYAERSCDPESGLSIRIVMVWDPNGLRREDVVGGGRMLYRIDAAFSK